MEHLPEELIERIFKPGGGEHGEMDFVLTTCSRRASSNPNLPLMGMGATSDVVVRGIPVGGMIYVTKVYGQPGFENSYVGHRNSRFPEAREDLGTEKCEWYTPLRRDASTKPIDPKSITHNPVAWGSVAQVEGPKGQQVYMRRVCKGAVNSGHDVDHKFLADDWTRQLYLSVTQEELDLLAKRHDFNEHHRTVEENDMSTPASRKTAERLVKRAEWRMEDIRDSDAFQLMRVPNGTVNKSCGHQGTKLLLGLTNKVKIFSHSKIIASLPILSRVSVVSPDDELLKTSDHVRNQLERDHDKWLACVPADWIFAWQDKADVPKFGGPDVQPPKIDSLRMRIHALQTHSNAAIRGQYDGSDTSQGGRPFRVTGREAAPAGAPADMARNLSAKIIRGTKFDEAAALLVAVFLSHGGRSYDLNDGAVLDELLALAQKDRFKDRYGVHGPLLTSTPPSGIARCKTLDQQQVEKRGARMKLFGGKRLA